MPVLLLAQGDTIAKCALRKAIEARYGTRPPSLDSLKINFNGRTLAKVGPVKTWVPVEVTAYFRFPMAMRWDFTVKPLKLPVQRGLEAFDGATYHSARGGKPPTVITDPAQVASMRRRMWAIAAILLTPLSELFVKLSAIGENSLWATNTKLDDAAEIHLRPDNSLDYVRVECLNPDDNRWQNYIIRLSEELVCINDLLLPAKMSAFWDDAPNFEFEPGLVESNPNIPDSVFTLAE